MRARISMHGRRVNMHQLRRDFHRDRYESGGAWSLCGRTLLCTGSTKGIGRAIVDELLRKEGRVVACARSAGDVSEMQTEYDADKVLVLQADVTSPGEVLVFTFSASY